jgi:hypothetical protein
VRVSDDEARESIAMLSAEATEEKQALTSA